MKFTEKHFVNSKFWLSLIGRAKISKMDVSYLSSCMLDQPFNVSECLNQYHADLQYGPSALRSIQHRPWLPGSSSNYSTASFSDITHNPVTSNIPHIQQNEGDHDDSFHTALADTQHYYSFSTMQHSYQRSVCIGQLNNAFASTDNADVRGKVMELKELYLQQVSHIETTRNSQLKQALTNPLNTWTKDMINAYYDNLHHSLISRTLQSLQLLQQNAPKNVFSHDTQSQLPVRLLSEKAASADPSILPKAQLNQQCPLPETNAISVAKATATPRIYKRLYRRKGVLNSVAVRIMSAWYQNNSEHPYPSYETAQVMADAGDITVEQVNKWFANHRRRTNNTKPMKEIAERRKVLKRCRSSFENDDIFLTEAKRSRD